MLVALQDLTLSLKDRDRRVECLDSWNCTVNVIDYILLALAFMLIEVELNDRVLRGFWFYLVDASPDFLLVDFL